ncbi:hypothetical protein [Streptomyces sp. NPDC001675]
MAGNKEEEKAQDLPVEPAEPGDTHRKTERRALVCYTLGILYYDALIVHAVGPWAWQHVNTLVNAYM